MLHGLFRKKVEASPRPQSDLRTLDIQDALLAIAGNHRETLVQIWDRKLSPVVYEDPRVMVVFDSFLRSRNRPRLEVYTTPQTFRTWAHDHPCHRFVNRMRDSDNAVLHAVQDTAMPDNDIIVGAQGKGFMSLVNRHGIFTSDMDTVANLRLRLKVMAFKAAPASP